MDEKTYIAKWKRKFVIPKRDIESRGGNKILKGTICMLRGYDRSGLTISTGSGSSAIIISGISPHDLELVD